jgi:site-specific DNA-methyltransferase (adenine-specific)
MGGGINDRRTPPDLYKRYDDRFDFTLDAAASHENALCDVYCTLNGTFSRSGPTPYLFNDGDGLSCSWAHNTVWVNPPYGRGLLAPFVAKAHRAVTAGAAAVVMLLPVRTEQPWFQDIVWPDVKAGRASIEWCRGRLHFDELGAASFPSMVVIWRSEALPEL